MVINTRNGIAGQYEGVLPVAISHRQSLHDRLLLVYQEETLFFISPFGKFLFDNAACS